MADLIAPLLALALGACAWSEEPDVATEGTTSETGSGTSTDGTTTGTSCGTSTGTSWDTSTSSTSGGSGQPDSGDVPEECLGVDGPWTEPQGPGDEACSVMGPAAEACETADDIPGYRLCLGFEVMEDVTEHSWGPCLPSCGQDEFGDSHSCGQGDGMSFCDSHYVDGEEVFLWWPCAKIECIPCELGDTELCGPDTPYPETIKECVLNWGVPHWFDGNCWT